MNRRTAALKRSTSKVPSSILNFIRFREARLHAVSSRNRYSEQGLVEFCRPVPLQVCHLWMVVSNCIPANDKPEVCVLRHELEARRGMARVHWHNCASRFQNRQDRNPHLDGSV